MNDKKIIHLSILLMMTFIIGSCTTWSAKEWEALKDRTFYFQSLKFYAKGYNQATAFNLFKAFPVDKILRILAHKYNIIADSSEFENLILSDDNSKIVGGGLLGLLRTDFIWESKDKHINTIELKMDQILEENSSLQNKDKMTNYILSLKIDGKERKLFQGVLSFNTSSVLATIARDMGYKRLNKNSDDYYVNKDNNSILDLTSGEPEAKSKESTDERKITQETIRQQIKEYVNTLPREDKKKFRDDIIKFLYGIIE